MTPLINPAHLQNICYDCGGILGFTPNVAYTYDASTGAIVVTDSSTYPTGDALKRMQVIVTDRDGKEVRGQLGGVKSTAITAAGSGFTSAPTVAFSGGGGTGAAGYATISGGAVTGIVITNPGINYTSAPTIALTGGAGTGATATAAVNTTSVTLDATSLNRSKPLNINLTIVTNNNIIADGSVWGTLAAGTFASWDASQQSQAYAAYTF